MDVVASDVVEIVVLARHAHTLLRIGDAGVRAAVSTEEHFFKLHHARIGEEQRGVIARYQRHRRDDGVALLFKIIQERLANFRAGFWTLVGLLLWHSLRLH